MSVVNRFGRTHSFRGSGSAIRAAHSRKRRLRDDGYGMARPSSRRYWLAGGSIGGLDHANGNFCARNRHRQERASSASTLPGKWRCGGAPSARRWSRWRGRRATILATASGRLGISPKNRTSPLRPLSAIATEIAFLCVSIATYVVVRSFMARSPCIRLWLIRQPTLVVACRGTSRLRRT